MELPRRGAFALLARIRLCLHCMNASKDPSLAPVPADRLFGAARCESARQQARDSATDDAMLLPAGVARDAAPSYCAWPAELLPD